MPMRMHWALLALGGLLVAAPWACGSSDDGSDPPGAGGAGAGTGAGGGTTSSTGGSGAAGGGGSTGTGGAISSGGFGGTSWQVPSGCLQHSPPMLFDTSDNCMSQPEIDRVFDVQPLRWKGSDFMLVNEGNEFKVWNVDQPDQPQVVQWQTHFNVPNVGDSDYDLFDIAVCDDCRYGAVTYKASTVVLFDLGTGPSPQVIEQQQYTSALGSGNLPFVHGGQLYLLNVDLKDECGGDLAALHRFNGILPGELELVQCVPQQLGVTGSVILGGLFVPRPDADYVYVTGQFSRIHIFRVDDVGESITLTPVGPSFTLWGTAGYQDSFAVDLRTDPPLAVSAVGNSVAPALTIYDLSNPAEPAPLSTVPLSLTRAAIWYPFVWTSGATGGTYTFDITDPHNPVPLDQDLWDPSHPWNSFDCEHSYDATFHPNGSMLYVARYSVLQKISVCGPPGGW